MKKDKTEQNERYHSIFIEPFRALVKIGIKKQKIEWETPYEGEPALFVCNHERAFGPLVMLSHFPLAKKLSPWVIGEVCSAKTLPKYAREDFWCKPNKWYTKIYNYTIPYIAALIMPPIMKGIRAIGVFHDARIKNTFKESVDTLSNGGTILLFPEKPEEFGKYGTALMNGFVLTARLYENKTGKPLNMYPVYINKKKSKILVAAPINVSHSANAKEDTLIVADQINNKMQELKIQSNK